MILFLITILTAIAISAVAAYFSIVGLVAIFSSAPIAIAIMGTTLEVGKLVTASWVYRNWNTAPTTIKYYFTVAVVILSLITSMGIFGYLSKAHIEQTSATSASTVQLKILEERERVARQRIDFLLNQNDKTTSASTRISRDLSQAQAELKEIINEKLPLMQEKTKFEVELGPIKYITEFIYGTADENLVNKAVRWVIITLIFVFDPLAILLLIAANITYNNVVKDNNVIQELRKTLTTPRKKQKWSGDFFKDPSDDDPSKIKIEKSKIHEIPKEILEKVFKK